MNYFILLPGILNLLLGLVVLLKNYRDKGNILFMVFTLSAAITCFFDFMFRFYPTVRVVSFAYAFAVLIPMLAFLWVRSLLKKDLNIFLTLLLLAPGFVFFYLALFTDKIVASVDKLLVLGYKGTLGSGFVYYSNYFLVLSVAIILLLFLEKRKSTKLKKVQLRFIITGFILYMLSGMIFSLIFPSMNNYNFTMLDAPSSLFFIGFSTYAIIKHKFLDIRLVVARSVAYILLISSLAGIYAGSVLGLERLLFPQEAAQFNLAQGIMRTIIAVIMVFLFQPLKKWITNATDKIFFKNQYDPQKLMDELSHTISSNIVLVEMLYKTNDLLIKNLKVSRSGFVILKDDGEFFTSQSLGYRGWPPIDIPDFHKMAKKGTLVYDELEDGSTYKRLLKKYDASFFLPLYADNKIVGIYLAGEKNSGDMFSQKDIQMFEIMAPEVAVAVENSKSYEEISRFNVTLRQEIKRATKRLKDKNTELQELDKAKDEFISMASHQLRTPLTAIKGYLSMLLEGDAGEIKVSQYDFINEAYNAAGRMVGLINDLLNVSRMETGRFFLEPKEVDIETIVDEEVKQLQNHAREKGLYLKIEKGKVVPHIFADETKIRQVVMNFIDNAIYYTQKGGVTVKLSKDKDNFIFQVIDTGIGVPKAQQKNLFQKFFRADNARTTRPDGTGLGIYLAKRVTEDHGGKVLFHSEEGKGSMFGFTFPIKTKVKSKLQASPATLNIENRPAAPALASASTTFTEKSVGIEPPVPTSVEAGANEKEKA